MSWCKGRESGTTLIEILVSLGLFSMLLVGVFGGMTRLFTVSYDDLLLANIHVNSSAAIDKVKQELQWGRVDPLPVDGSSLTSQIPVDPDGDGSVIGNDGLIQWGAEIGGVDVAGATTTFQFVADGMINEVALGVDLNRDGDQLDQFDRGHLERLSSNGAIVVMTGSWILQPRVNYGGDLDGDGVNDPIFSSDETRLQKTILVDITVVVPTFPNRWRISRRQFTLSLHNDFD